MKAYSIIRRKTRGAVIILLLFVVSGIISMINHCNMSVAQVETGSIESNA